MYSKISAYGGLLNASIGVGYKYIQNYRGIRSLLLIWANSILICGRPS